MIFLEEKSLYGRRLNDSLKVSICLFFFLYPGNKSFSYFVTDTQSSGHAYFFVAKLLKVCFCCLGFFFLFVLFGLFFLMQATDLGNELAIFTA